MTTIDEVRAGTLDEARQRLRIAAVQPGGSRCPCCQQHVQIYRRKINSGMARSLIEMYRISGVSGEWVHVPTQLNARSREEGKLSYWGLLEEENTAREDGGRAGYWRITALGVAFVRGFRRVPKYALVYDGRVLMLQGDETVSIQDALGTKFSLEELLHGE